MVYPRSLFSPSLAARQPACCLLTLSCSQSRRSLRCPLHPVHVLDAGVHGGQQFRPFEPSKGRFRYLYMAGDTLPHGVVPYDLSSAYVYHSSFFTGVNKGKKTLQTSIGNIAAGLIKAIFWSGSECCYLNRNWKFP